MTNCFRKDAGQAEVFQERDRKLEDARRLRQQRRRQAFESRERQLPILEL